MAQSRLAAVQAEIRRSFSAEPYPGDERLVTRPKDWEAAEMLEAFRGKRWQEISRELLQHRLAFLSPEGLRYYLPAYLLAALEPSVDDDVLASVIHHLEPSDPISDWEIDRFSIFRPAQRLAIRAFLDYTREQFAQSVMSARAEAALQRYWGI